jgi:predicted metal-dependent phosphotriesterase family hydrolase
VSPVRTVLGDVESHRLGFTHCHEHLFVFPIRGVKLPEKLIIDDFAKTSRELVAFRCLGGSTLVDAQPFGAGRHAELLARASRETGVSLIGSTGSRTAFRAGLIKIATGAEGLRPYRNLFEAAAEAHRRTGAPIMTHTEMSAWGREQALFLMERGVAAGAVIVSHMDRVVDLEANLALADLGVFLQYDTIARFRYHSDEQEAELIRRMIQAGFADRILLGMDATRQRLPAYGGRYGYSYVAGTFLPLLRRRGVEEADIQRMVLGNPGRALSLKGRQS